jgi:hypothetical protein
MAELIRLELLEKRAPALPPEQIRTRVGVALDVLNVVGGTASGFFGRDASVFVSSRSLHNCEASLRLMAVQRSGGTPH